MNKNPIPPLFSLKRKTFIFEFSYGFPMVWGTPFKRFKPCVALPAMRSAVSTDSHGRALPIPRNSRDQVASDYFKDLMRFNVIYWVLLGFDGISWDLMGCKLGFIGMYPLAN